MTETKSECKDCQGDNFILLGCCNGRDCGCMGGPVQVTNCKKCNPNGLAEMSKDIARYDMLEYVGD